LYSTFSFFYEIQASQALNNLCKSFHFDDVKKEKEKKEENAHK